MATLKKSAPTSKKIPTAKTAAPVAKVTRRQKPFTISISKFSSPIGNFSWSYISKGKTMMQSAEPYASNTAAKNAAKAMIALIQKQDVSVIAFENI